VYNHCNIPIYFYNIRMKHLQYTSETLETYAYNMQFQLKHLLAAWRMKVHRQVEFAGGRSSAVLIGSGLAVAAVQGRVVVATRRGKEAAALRHAWQG
jgi:hypothetical protein